MSLVFHAEMVLANLIRLEHLRAEGTLLDLSFLLSSDAFRHAELGSSVDCLQKFKGIGYCYGMKDGES